MVAPKKWRRFEWLACAENVAGRRLTLPLGHYPVLHPGPACARIGPARDVAGGKNSRYVRLQIFIDQNAVIGRDPCFFSKRSVRADTDSNDHQVAIQNCPVVELHLSILDGRRYSPEIKFYAVRFMSFTNQICHFTPENFFERLRMFSHHCDLDLPLSQLF